MGPDGNDSSILYSLISKSKKPPTSKNNQGFPGISKAREIWQHALLLATDINAIVPSRMKSGAIVYHQQSYFCIKSIPGI